MEQIQTFTFFGCILTYWAEYSVLKFTQLDYVHRTIRWAQKWNFLTIHSRDDQHNMSIQAMLNIFNLNNKTQEYKENWHNIYTEYITTGCLNKPGQ